MPTVLLLRHATAEPYASSDAARPLSPHGLRQASHVAQHLSTRELVPDVVLCSTALRTRQTWQTIEENLGPTAAAQCHMRDDLYQASPDAVQSLVAQQSPAQVVLVVGHEPIMSMTAARYAGPQSDEVAVMTVSVGMPTAGLAIIEVESLASLTGTLVELVRS